MGRPLLPRPTFPVWALHPTPVARGEVGDLGQVADGDLGGDADGVTPVVIHDEHDLASDLPTEHGEGAVGLRGPAFFSPTDDPLLVRLEVFEPPQGLRGRLSTAKGDVLATWECPEDELDLFTASANHLLHVALMRNVSGTGPTRKRRYDA